MINKISKEWVTEKRTKLEAVSSNYSTEQKEQIKLLYLNNLLAKLAEMEIEENDRLIDELNDLIDYLPNNFEELIYTNYLSKLRSLEYTVRERLNLIPYKEHHMLTINNKPFSFLNIFEYILVLVFVPLVLLVLNKPFYIIGIIVPLAILIKVLIKAYIGKQAYNKAEKENRLI